MSLVLFKFVLSPRYNVVLPAGVLLTNLGYILEPIDYTQVMLIIGIVLVILGIRFQSSTED